MGYSDLYRLGPSHVQLIRSWHTEGYQMRRADLIVRSPLTKTVAFVTGLVAGGAMALSALGQTGTGLPDSGKSPCSPPPSSTPGQDTDTGDVGPPLCSCEMPIADCSDSMPRGIDPALLTPDTFIPDPSITLPDDMESDPELDPTDIICSFGDVGAEGDSSGSPACASASRTVAESLIAATPNYQGYGWYQNSRPELIVDSESSPTYVRIVASARRVFDFKLVSGSSPKVFVGVNGHQGIIEHIAGTGSAPELYQYRNRSGRVYTFFGYSTNSSAWLDPQGAKGQLWKVQGTDGSGSVSYIGHATNPATAMGGFVQQSSQPTPRAQSVYDSAGRLRTYNYTDLSGSPMLTSIVITASSVEVQRVEYSYYTSDGDHGLFGDLKTVTWTTPLSSGGNLVETTYLRYYTDAEYHSTNHPGFKHQIKMMVGPEGIRRFGGEYGSASDADLKPYAKLFYKYESTYGKVSEMYENGSCGCSGAVDGWYGFSSAVNSSYSSGTAYTSAGTTGTSDWDYDRWKRRTIIDRPDGTKMAIYFDEMNLWIGRVISDAADSDPWDPAANKLWITKLERDGRMRPTRVFTPEAVNWTTYTHTSTTGDINTRSSAGLVHAIEYYTPSCGDNFLPDAVITRKLQIGSSGSTELIQEAMTYADPKSCSSGSNIATYTSSGTAARIARPLPITRRLYRDNSTYDETTYAYTFHSGWQVKSATATLPSVSTSENGAGSTHTRVTYTDARSRTVFSKDESGVYDWTGFSSTTGQVVDRIKDAKSGTGNSGLNSDATAFSISLPGGGLHLETIYAYDAQGRLDAKTLPSGRITAQHYTRLDDGRLVVLSSPKRTGSYPSYTYHSPATYNVINLASTSEANGSIALADGGGTTTTGMDLWVDTSLTDPLAAIYSGVGTLSSATITILDESGTRREETRQYTILGGSPAYDATSYSYDDMGRVTSTTDRTSTITDIERDALGRVTETWVGTSSMNKVKVSSTEYDANGVGNSLVTRSTSYVDSNSANDRHTDYKYDAFNRAVAMVNPESPHSVVSYDNQERVLAAAEYSTSSLSGSSTPTTTTDRLSYSQHFYDSRGRMWKKTTHAVGSTGTSTDSLDMLVWYDETGREIKRRGTSLTKVAYDRIGRSVREYVLASDNDSDYSGASSIAGDTVLEESQTYFENATSLPLMQVVIRRHANDTSTTGALDTDSDLSLVDISGSAIKGRAQISTYFYDALERRTHVAERGTNGGSNYDRDSEGSDSASAPASSASVLVATTTFGSDGRVTSTTDPLGRQTRYTRDLLGRELTVIRNYVDGTPSADTDQKIEYVYDDGHLVSMTAKMPSSGDDQTTTYTYGVDKDTAADSGSGGFISGISSNRLLYKATYPDSAGASDAVRYGYNRQGEIVKTRDQAGNIIETDLDAMAREMHRRATTITGGFDDTVKRISLGYDSRGRVDTVTQYNNATAGSGTALDQVEYTYDDWGNITKFEQDVDGVIGAGGRGSFWTSYSLAKSAPSGGPHLVRRTQHQTEATGGSSQTVAYSYGSSGAIDDKASRLQSMSIGAATIASYQYMGAGTLVYTNLDQPALNTGVFESSSTTYPDLDRFDRPTTWDWWHGTDAAFYDVDIKYDLNSNPTATLDNIHVRATTSKHIFDVAYGIDGLDRLTQADEGSVMWNGTSQQWEVESSYHTRNELWNSLSLTGNWSNRKLDANGDGDFTDVGDRDEPSANNSFNKANEWTDRRVNRNSGQYDNYDYTYDAVGNLAAEDVTINAGGSPTALQQREYVYDVFGRLVGVKGGIPDENGLPYVAQYRYNGLGFRIMWQYDADTDGTLEDSDRYYFLYDERWRSLATYRDDDEDPKERFTYHNAGTAGLGHASYIDSVVLRDKDANTAWTAASDETLEERLYYIQNWRADVVSLWSSDGEPVEYVRYSAYGEPFCYPVGDVNRDGVTNTADSSEWADYFSGGTSHTIAVPLDINADSLFPDGDDTAVVNASVIANAGFTGKGKVSSVGSRISLGGHNWDAAVEAQHARRRVYSPSIGRWLRRDPLGYADTANLYEMVSSAPLSQLDPFGLDGGGVYRDGNHIRHAFIWYKDSACGSGKAIYTFEPKNGWYGPVCLEDYMAVHPDVQFDLYDYHPKDFSIDDALPCILGDTEDYDIRTGDICNRKAGDAMDTANPEHFGGLPHCKTPADFLLELDNNTPHIGPPISYPPGGPTWPVPGGTPTKPIAPGGQYPPGTGPAPTPAPPVAPAPGTPGKKGPGKKPADVIILIGVVAYLGKLAMSKQRKLST